MTSPRPPLRVLVAQLDFVVGDISGNRDRIIETLGQARGRGADLAVFPELAVCGYPPEDLLLRPSFLAANASAIAEIAGHSAGLTAVVGFADGSGGLYNAAAVLHDGALAAVVHKTFLPNYSVFDEERYFDQGQEVTLVNLGGVGIGVSICEDIWYPAGPPQLQALAGAEVLVNLSASPYFRGKGRHRERMLATRAADTGAYVVFCNLIGGQDELIFDGNSLVIGPGGEVLGRGASFHEDLFVVDLQPEEVFRRRLIEPRVRTARRAERPPGNHREVALARPAPADRPPLPERVPLEPLAGLAEIYAALLLGTRDYVHKNGFHEVVIGLSGGIDSALTAVIATDALGADHVVGVRMPSRYSSPSSLEDAAELAENLGIRLLTIPIDATFQAYLDMLEPSFEGRGPDVTEENLQPRIRGNILMALSNKLGHLVLTTGNKSETSVGYVTLYGDSAGGFAPLKDVPKTLVYALARWRNDQPEAPVIPEDTLTRPPSAELRPHQLDADSLPPYEVLDPILLAYVEEEKSMAQIVALGFDPAMVERVMRMVDRAEYKRRQSPPGIKITERAFGRDRRMPITQRTGR
jgi:NAD+ synthase (glutamine-hydrolysing)